MINIIYLTISIIAIIYFITKISHISNINSLMKTFMNVSRWVRPPRGQNWYSDKLLRFDRVSCYDVTAAAFETDIIENIASVGLIYNFICVLIVDFSLVYCSVICWTCRTMKRFKFWTQSSNVRNQNSNNEALFIMEKNERVKSSISVKYFITFSNV